MHQRRGAAGTRASYQVVAERLVHTWLHQRYHHDQRVHQLSLAEASGNPCELNTKKMGHPECRDNAMELRLVTDSNADAAGLHASLR